MIPAPSDFYEEEVLRIAPLPESALRAAALPQGRTLLDELRRHEGRIAQERRSDGKGFLGAERVLAQDPLGAPAHPKRSPRPLCHTSLRGLYLAYRDRLAVLRRAYAEASARYRAGAFTIEFPRFLYRPPVPVLLTG